MEAQNKYNDLLRCRTTTEEEQQQPQEVHKEPQVNFVVRCDLKAFAKAMTDLPAKRLKLLEDSPFYKLSETMSGHVQNNKVIKKLASLFSVNNKSLSLLLDGTRFIVTPQDFTSIMGVEDGDEDVIIRKNSKLEKEPEVTSLFLKENGMVVSNDSVLKQLTHTKDKDTLSRAFALLALQKIICAPSNGTLGRSYLKYVREVTALRRKKWATHAIHLLVRSINTYKNSRKKTRKLGGCTVFLQLYVMKKISETIPVELSDETRKKMIADKLDELLETHNKDLTDLETARLLKNIMLQRNESLISALEKAQKKCLSKVKNKKTSDYLKKDGEDVMFQIGSMLDAKMAVIDSIMECGARIEEEAISQKRKAENELEKDASEGKRKKTGKVIEPKHAMETRSRRTRKPVG